MLQAIISDHRWAIQFVEDARRPFAYTVGLHGMGQPELLITGVSAQPSARLPNSIAHHVVDGDLALRPGAHIDHQGEFLFEVVEVEHPDVHLKCAVGLFGPRIRAFQLVWADDRHRWPWDPATCSTSR